MSDKLAKVQVTVQTLAKPIPAALLAARTAIRVSPELQALFTKARTESWSAESLADALHLRLPEYVLAEGDLWETALYLADEYLQLGDHTLLISRETGQALAKITEDDIYIPAPVPRETEDGSVRLAQPLPRLRPDLEGFLVEWHFTQGREAQVQAALATKGKQTALLKEEGDGRLLQATRSGRKQIADRLRSELLDILPSCTGAAKQFLDLFTFCTEPPSEGGIDCEFMARSITPVADPLSFNLRHDPFLTLRARVGTQWVRELASFVSQRVPLKEASILDEFEPGFWVADPNTALALAQSPVLAVLGAKDILIPNRPGALGSILVRVEGSDCKSREFLDRWEVAAKLQCTVYLDLSNVLGFSFHDVPQSGVAVEVLS